MTADNLEILARLEEIARGLRAELGVRICKADGCERPIPEDRRFDAEYCNKKCKWRMAQKKYRQAQEGKDK